MISESPVAAIVLAAGLSRRWGADNKLLADVNGMPMIRRTVQAVLGSSNRPVIVVTGHDAGGIANALAGLPVAFAHAADYAVGMSASLRTAVSAVPSTCAGALICLGDMPFVSPATLDSIAQAFDPEAAIAVAPAYQGRRGNPALLGRRLFHEILLLTGDAGARSLLDEAAGRVVELAVDDAGVLRDLDRPEALEP